MPTLVVWDVKTVLDLEVLAAANGAESGMEESSRDLMGEDAANPIYRAIVCIAWLIAHYEPDRWIVDSVNSSHVGAKSEADVIKEFFDVLADLKPQLVTFKGSDFLEYRAMRHKLAMPQFEAQLHNPYALEELSLCDIFSPNPRQRISLRQLCGALGLGYDGLDGGEIEKWFRQNRAAEIASYCEREVLSIFQIWLRRELYIGRMSRHDFDRCEVGFD
jgi:predicted PolB exonuclease-like 3'-5' exonuclease